MRRNPTSFVDRAEDRSSCNRCFGSPGLQGITHPIRNRHVRICPPLPMRLAKTQCSSRSCESSTTTAAKRRPIEGLQQLPSFLGC
jgi:hypothetical protein